MRAFAGTCGYDVVRYQVSVNLILDGVTNAEQDRITGRFKAPGSYMMLAINIWILTFHFVYLATGWVLYGGESELARAIHFMITFPEVRGGLSLIHI